MLPIHGLCLSAKRRLIKNRYIPRLNRSDYVKFIPKKRYCRYFWWKLILQSFLINKWKNESGQNGIIFAILLFLSCVNVSAQVIKGRVTDSTTNEALSYAAVEIRSFEDDVYIGGSSTNEKGEFEFHLKGRYPKIRITVSFLGYKTYKKAILNHGFIINNLTIIMKQLKTNCSRRI